MPGNIGQSARTLGKALALLLFTALLATAALLPGGARAAEVIGWSVPQNISNNQGDSALPSIAVDSEGNLHVVWKDGTTGNVGLLHSIRSSSGNWSAPQKIPGTQSTSTAPRIAVGYQGILYVVWQGNISGESGIFWNLRGSNGDWSTSQKITGSSDISKYPDIAVDAQGNPHVVWEEESPSSDSADIVYATRSGQTDWVLQNISDNVGLSRLPSVAVDGAGKLHVVWQDDTSGYADILYAAKPGNGAWSVPRNISHNQRNSSRPRIAVDGVGNPHVVWEETYPTEDDEVIDIRVQYATRSGDNWLQPVNIFPPSVSLFQFRHPAIAVDSTGKPQVVWHDDINVTAEGYPVWSIAYAIRQDNGDWSTWRNISQSGLVATEATIAVDAWGNPHVVWQRSTAAGIGGNLDVFYTTLLTAPPNQPTNVSPQHGATGLSLTPTLESSAFSDPESADRHYASQWQATTTPGDYTSPVFDSGADTQGLTQTSTPSDILEYDTTYYWHVRYRDSHGNWSTYSGETSFTTMGPSTPYQPSNVLPQDGATGLSLTPMLESSAFSDPESADSHAASQWQITTAPGDYSSPVFDSGADTANLTQISIPSDILEYDSAYYWHVRYRDSHGNWSTYSGETSFTTMGPSTPYQPSNVLPQDGATGLSLTPMLESSAFSDPESADSHAASQWQITTAPGDYSSPVFDSGADTANLTQISIPSDILEYDSAYYWHVRYQDSHGSWSAYSSETSFTTKGRSSGWIWPVIGGIVGGAVVLATVTWLQSRRHRPSPG
ncbi:MAG: hypothetical protein A2Y91_05390 [Chloroflexi bacterium RBG_13_54_8]|nr:MAG: hypothetical protein A2Y91_05390 [Chloroflexi bacterium RBG_13_54_8]